MKLTTVTMKNFLSIGNREIRFDLNSNINTLIFGTNGHGKSTIIEAIYFALTGKPFRDINKPQLVNTINKKDCVVTLEVYQSGHKYFITRGIKPNIFTIVKDSVALDEDSRVGDFQTFLESVLKFDSKNLKHTMFMSVDFFKPFLKLSPADKRTFIEDLLDINVISKMVDNLKRRRTTTKEKIQEYTAEIERYNSNISIIQNAKTEHNHRIERLKAERLETIERMKRDIEDTYVRMCKQREETMIRLKDDRIKSIEKMVKERDLALVRLEKAREDKKNKIAEDKTEENTRKLKVCEQEIFENSAIIAECNAKVVVLQDKICELDVKEQKGKDKLNQILNINTERAKFAQQIESENKILQFFEDNSDCPTCKQPISSDHKSEMVENIKSAIEKLKTKTLKCDEDLKNLEEIKVRLNKLSEVRQQYRDDIQCEKNIISNTTQSNEKLAREISSLKSPQIQEIQEDIEIEIPEVIELPEVGELPPVVKNEMVEIPEVDETPPQFEDETKYHKLLAASEHNLSGKEKALNYINKMLVIMSDTGIKAYIVKRYIPIINQYVNGYLETLGASYRLMFDEFMNETIAMKGYEKLSYGSFSKGERSRTDLALLFAFLRLARVKASMDSNVAFYDEILDSLGLDETGINGLFDILDMMKREGQTNIVISHRQDLHARFDIAFHAVKDQFTELNQIS